MHFNSVSWVFFTPKKLCNNWGSNEHYNILAYVCSINYSFISPLCLISTLGNSANTDSIHQAKFIPTLEINKKFYLQRQNLKWKYVMEPDKKWTNCINVQCIAARIRMISPLGKSTFTPIAYQSRLQWLKGVDSSISNYFFYSIQCFI